MSGGGIRDSVKLALQKFSYIYTKIRYTLYEDGSITVSPNKENAVLNRNIQILVPNSFDASFYLMPTVEAEVSTVLRSIASKHSSGIDDLPCFLVRYVSGSLGMLLVYLINR